MSNILKGLNEGRSYGRDSWDSNMPGYQGDYGGAANWGRRNREDDEHHEIDAVLAARHAQRQEYERNGKFWLKLKDSQRHLPAGPFTGKQAANIAAVELLKQQPELKGNLLITAYGPDETQGVAEGSEGKTPGIALSKAYKKDFDDKKPGQDRKETALTGTYSKTGKPGGELKKQGVAEDQLDEAKIASSEDEDFFHKGKKVGSITKITLKDGMVYYRASAGNSHISGSDTRQEALRDLKELLRREKQQGVAEAEIDRPGMKDGRPYSDPYRRHPGNSSYMTPEYLIQKYKERLEQIAAGPYKRPKEVAQLQSCIAKLEKQGVAEGLSESLVSKIEELGMIGRVEYMGPEYKTPYRATLQDKTTGKVWYQDFNGGKEAEDWLANNLASYEKWKNGQQGVAEGLSDIVKGVKRKVAGKEDPKEVEHTYGRIARSAIKHKTPDQAEKDIERYKKVAKVVNKEGVAEGLSKRDQQDVAAIRAAIARLESQLNHPNADKAAIQQSIAHEKKRLALYGQSVAEGSEEGFGIEDMVMDQYRNGNEVWEIASNMGMSEDEVQDIINDSEQGVTEGSDERSQNRLWQMITDYEQRAKATKNDIKKDHYLKMASELRGKLKTSDEQGVAEDQLDELSNKTLASYKKKAGADASQADKRGDYARGDKRMSGIIKATKKEFDNDAKGIEEEKQRLDPSCWKGYKKQGTKMKGDTRVNNCVPVKESAIMKGLK